MRTEASKPIPGRLGVITRNVVPMYAKADAKSEQVTQGLIGQPVIAEGGQGNWVFAQTWDGYRAWVQADRVKILPSGDSPYASAGPVAVMRELFVDIFTEPTELSEIITKATIATEIEVARTHNDWVELKLPSGRHGFLHKNKARLVDRDVAQAMWLPEPRKLVETAMRFVGVPYLWGGTSPFGLDCSGFVQLVYKIHDVTLLRDAHMQAGDPRAEKVTKSQLRAGDLVFFGKNTDSDPSSITHVGMMLDKSSFIHSSGDLGVAITPIEDPQYSAIYWGSVRMRLETLDRGGGAPTD